MVRDSGEFHFFRTLGRVLKPKKYRLLVMNSLGIVFLFYSLILLFASVFTLVFNYGALVGLDVGVDLTVDNPSFDVFQNSFLVESVLRMFSMDGLFFVFLFPSVFLYLFLYLFVKYLAIAFVGSLLFFVLSGFFKIHVNFLKVFKINMFSICVMILFDLLGIPFYSLFQVPLFLYLVLSSLALYFVGSSSA